MKQTNRYCVIDYKKSFAGAKAGFTLVELLVYMAIVGVVVIIAGQAFSDSTKMRMRTQSMIKVNETSGDLASILKDDISQIGTKSSMDIGGGAEDVFYTGAIHDVYMDPDNTNDDLKDSSSFILVKDEDGNECFHDHAANNGNHRCDKLSMRRISYNTDGTYNSVEQISWFVEDGTLKRSCRTIAGHEDDVSCPNSDSTVVSIVDNVENFVVIPANPNVSESMTSVLPSASSDIENFRLVSRYDEGNFEPVDFDNPDGGQTIKIQGFASNYNFEENAPVTNPADIRVNQIFVAEANSDPGAWKDLCKVVTLDPGIEYEISFSMPSNGSDPSRMFCPGRDHMSVGFRYIDDGKAPSTLTDFAFYPPTDGNVEDVGVRHMRFFVPDTIKNVCLGFTFSSFSPIAHSGSIKLSKVKLKKIASSSYSFNDAAIGIADKKNVKAMKLQITIRKNGEAGSSTLFIPIPSNGPRD